MTALRVLSLLLRLAVAVNIAVSSFSKVGGTAPSPTLRTNISVPRRDSGGGVWKDPRESEREPRRETSEPVRPRIEARHGDGCGGEAVPLRDLPGGGEYEDENDDVAEVWLVGVVTGRKGSGVTYPVWA